MHNAISISLYLCVAHALGTCNQHLSKWLLTCVIAELG